MRVRRSAEAAREAILDAAERLLQEVGPDGIRLQAVAARIGVSHPALLHHFGSREALVEAVVDRAVARLEEDLLAVLSAPGDPDPVDLLARVSATLADRGHARLVAWLTLSGRASSSERSRANWARIVAATHQARLALVPGLRDRPQDELEEDTRFTVLLSAFALFGEALAGDVHYESAGVDAEARWRFRGWLGALLLDHLARG
jgi:AcrR family transcriptional regulator